MYIYISNYIYIRNQIDLLLHWLRPYFCHSNCLCCTYISAMSLNVRPRPVETSILKARYEFLDKLEAQLAGSIQWQDCESPAAYRKMRREGLNGFPAPVLNPKARTVTISARDGHGIELRIITPTKQESKGVWLHFHAGEE